MRDRVLAEGFLEDLVAEAGGPFADAPAAALALGVRLVEVADASPLRSLVGPDVAYAASTADASSGLAQTMLLRANVGHGDDDVRWLARLLVGARAQPREHDSDAIPMDIDS